MVYFLVHVCVQILYVTMLTLFGRATGMRIKMRRQCGPVVRALALRSRDPGFKTHSDHSLNLILVVPGSTSQLHL